MDWMRLARPAGREHPWSLPGQGSPGPWVPNADWAATSPDDASAPWHTGRRMGLGCPLVLRPLPRWHQDCGGPGGTGGSLEGGHTVLSVRAVVGGLELDLPWCRRRWPGYRRPAARGLDSPCARTDTTRHVGTGTSVGWTPVCDSCKAATTRRDIAMRSGTPTAYLWCLTQRRSACLTQRPRPG